MRTYYRAFEFNFNNDALIPRQVKTPYEDYGIWIDDTTEYETEEELLESLNESDYGIVILKMVSPKEK